MTDFDNLRDFLGQKPIELELRVPGIYFLFDGDNLVYVGKSYDVRSRINRHRLAMPNQFNNAFYVKEPDAKRRIATELDLIRTFNPSLNVSHTPRYKQGKRSIHAVHTR